MRQKRFWSVRGLKLWRVAYRISFLLFIGCLIGSFSLYFWPKLPTIAQPESGHVYSTPMHGVTLYWTKAQYWAHHLLLVLALISAGFRVAIAKFVLSVQAWR